MGDAGSKGALVGTGTGLSVGDLVGEGVGLSVGDLMGEGVGLTGASVGGTGAMGASVGALVGEHVHGGQMGAVGESVGRGVGRGVGRSPRPGSSAGGRRTPSMTCATPFLAMMSTARISMPLTKAPPSSGRVKVRSNPAREVATRPSDRSVDLTSPSITWLVRIVVRVCVWVGRTRAAAGRGVR